jgi:hypothetical protein
LTTSVNFQKTAQSEQSPNRRKFFQSGHPDWDLGCRWYIFRPKLLVGLAMEDVGVFCEHLVWNILRPFGIPYDHLVYFVVKWYIVPVLVCRAKKYLATQIGTAVCSRVVTNTSIHPRPSKRSTPKRKKTFLFVQTTSWRQGDQGVDVTIIIFCVFCHFSAQKIGVFLKNQCYDQIFAKTSSSLNKNANIFAKFFAKNIFKIITSVPCDKAPPLVL